MSADDWNGTGADTAIPSESLQQTPMARGAAMDRRAALKVVVAAPFAASLVWTEPEVMIAQELAFRARASGVAFEPKFFTTSEWTTVRTLADMIIPRDARSGSASDVGVPEFMDFMMIDQPGRQESMRAGLVWLDDESRKRFGSIFVEAAPAQRAQLLDELAWPQRATDSLKDGVTFFLAFRNLVLTGFWTTKVGIEDLQYQGNTYVTHWDGCPDAALAKLGVSYADLSNKQRR